MGGRPLGLGLVGGGGAIVLVMLLWLFVSGAQGGGIVLGLLLMLVLGGPLIGAGAYVLSQQSREAREAAAFASRRRIADSDRLFRAEIATTLRSLGQAAMADELQSPLHASAEWQSTIQLDDGQLALLNRYDDLVRERVRRLRDATNGQPAAAELRDLRQSIDQREDLLLRGRAAPALDASTLMRTEAPRNADLQAISFGDAVSRERANYVVESLAAYFANGQTWKLAHLVPTAGQEPPRWLYVGPGGLDVALLDENAQAQVPERAEASGTAVVDVTSSSGTARGVLVTYTRGRAGLNVVLTEEWPDKTRHVYSGSLVGSDELELWPSASLQSSNPRMSNG